ncbi:hypothetical protein LCGC14_2472630 [marine sediment metagenome]|uniref:DUF559 domain-containing protein n=1 Tax=marine sediment metagenome TaxID=412755 RepID=A0A0F9DM20_9ZZZZ
MKVVNLDGNPSNWKIRGSIVTLDNRTRSKYHILARQLLKERYPTITIVEEVPISVFHNNTLFLDFYIQIHQIAIEVHGEQHFKYTPHFHGNRMGFLSSQRNDTHKQLWCETNNIQLIILPYNKNEDEWRIKLE